MKCEFFFKITIAMATSTSSSTNHDHALQVIKKYRTYVDMIVDATITDDDKLNAAQEISENFEVIIVSPHYAGFLEYAIPRFLKFLREGEPQFIAEGVIQQLRKLILEIIHRIPTNDHLRVHYKNILTVMFNMLESENEENVLVCLRIIIELHRQFRPPMQAEIQLFLHFVKNIFKELPNNIKTSFEVVTITPTGYLPAEVNGGATAAPVAPSPVVLSSPGQSSKGNSQDVTSTGKTNQQTIIPKAVTSLKVLAELPIIVVLLFQLYKTNVLGEIREFIPLIIKTIVLQPSMQARSSSSFNKEIYVDFVSAQIKTLSFLAFIIRAYQEYVNNFYQNMVGGMLGLFRYCPQEVAHLRKELLIAARHILVTDIRNRFVPYIDQLFDEDVLIGSGWTARESLRPLAYSTLADLVHHVRSHLPLQHLSLAVHLFSKNVHDESLPVSIQTMSCKLLLNLVEGIRKSDEQGTGREILMRMLEVFVRKFHSIAMHELPMIMEKCDKKNDFSTNTTKEAVTATTTVDANANMQKVTLPSLVQESESSSSKKFVESKTSNFSAADCKSMVKTLVCGVKTITWGAGSCRDATTSTQAQAPSDKFFLPQETPLFSRLLKYALQALDIYQVVQAGNGTYYIRTPNSQQIRMKEEKEILEHFAGVFTMLNTNTFKEVFQENIEYLVNRIQANFALQIIPNSFLANPHTSATFATILMHFLLNKLDEMGTNVENSNLYLKLFKLVFGSVSLFASENEQMLKPHLHEVVNRSMELACTSKEPYNYFLLLRALFRSIGGGNHDLLYQEFLPLLPNLLQGLNNLQSGVHRQYMKDLFVELCLTVPVRLSSLLPYLPMLMDPLVSALNGSQTLVSQGLRTLELCVDNLQPDFLYDHIQPVRAELFQALWKTLRNQSDNIAHVAFRVLGKFGGGNRRMLKEPQRLQPNDTTSIGPCVSIFFTESNSPVVLPISLVIKTALEELKSVTSLAPQPTTSQQQQQQQQNNAQSVENAAFYKKQAWIAIQSFLVVMISFEDSDNVFNELLMHESFKKDFPITGKSAISPSVDEATTETVRNALLGMLVATSSVEIRTNVIPFLCHIVRHYTILGIAQQAGPGQSKPSTSPQGTDIHVLIDAIASVMMLEEKELCKTGELAILVMCETASLIIGDLYKALQLPLFEYLLEKLCQCCYERSWFAKAGGCRSIAFLMKTMPSKWVIEHQLSFAKALMFVMMDLTNEVSAGTVDSAKETLEKLVRQCNARDEKDEEIIATQKKCALALLQHLVREVVSANTVVREQAQSMLSVLSNISGKSVYDIIEPHKGLLEEMMPPKKHLLRHQPVNMQIALMDGNTFCANLEPRLFTLDPVNVPEHKIFFRELQFLCEAEDSQLQKLPCYKNVNSFSELRKRALFTLAAYYYIPQVRDVIFNSLYKALNSSSAEVQKAGNEALKKFLAKTPQVEAETVQQAIRPLFLSLGDHRALNLQVIKRLSYVMELFPHLFNEKLCDQLLTHLQTLAEMCITAANQIQQGAKPNKKMDDVIQICAAIINIFHLIPAASMKLLEPLIQMVLKVEKALLTSSSFRKPLLKFLVRFPSQTVDYFLSHINISQTSRLFLYFLEQDDAKALRGAIETSPLKLVNSTFLVTQSQAEEQAANFQNKLELQFQGIMIVRILVKFNDEWLSHNRVLIGHLRRIWTSESFQERINKDGVPVHRWREPKLLVKCLLNYVKHKPSEVELLFDLLRVFTHRHIPAFQFLKTFMKNVTKIYSVEQKRAVFFKFVDIVHDENFPQDLTAKVLQYIIIPMFVASFEKGETEAIIGGPPNPEQDNKENVISVFVSRVIDPENPFKTSDAVRILLLQFSALLVEHASQHIHDVNNKKQGRKLRRMMTFAWPCLLPNKQCDPATKYHGHLLLAHIISKFAIHKKIVLQVFHRLLKAHAAEARNVVRQALAILTPAVPTRMDDGNQMLAHWTKKIIVEDGHTLPQLVHMLQLLVRHYKVYYPVRNHLIQHMISAMQKLGFTSSATIENRKLAVDLANVIIEWEIRRTKEEQKQDSTEGKVEEKETPTGAVKRSAEETAPNQEAKKAKITTQVSVPKDGSLSASLRAPVEKHHADAVVNFLLRVACHVNESSTTVGSPGEALSKRCVLLLKTALKPGFWQGSDLKLAWLDKLFVTLDQTPGTNFNNVCTGLEVLTYLLTVVPREHCLQLLKPLQRGVVACMTCQNIKVIRAVHTFLVKLTSLFPLESATNTDKYEELELLYTNLGKVIYEGLSNYAKSATQVATSTLQGPLLFLKAAFSSCPSYIDRLINPCIRALQKMHKDHIGGSSVGDMLITCVDLVKSRLCSMDAEARKLFIFILAQLIEKSPDAKLLKGITKVTEEWIKARATPQSPTLREKAILLCRMMPNYEKRFPEDFELHAQYLELINYVYRDESLLATELVAKLEPAFMSGLKCTQPQIRSRFMEIFDLTVSKKLYERLLYIFCSQNWESMKSHFWIKQCIELLLAAAMCERRLHLSSTFNKLPSLLSILKRSSKQEAKDLLKALSKENTESKENDSDPAKVEPMAVGSSEEMNMLFVQECSEKIYSLMDDESYLANLAFQNNRDLALKTLLKRHHEFLTEQKNTKSTPFLGALAQLCHRDTSLSHEVWTYLFPELWKLLNEKQQQILAGELSPFMCSGTNCVQLDSHPSVVHTMLQAILRCEPMIPMRPSILKYLGKSHNQWHLSTLMLEDYVTLCEEYVSPPLLDPSPSLVESVYQEDVSDINSQETLDSLAEMYSLINEEDMWAGLWLRRARYPETATAIAYENQGFFEQAQTTYELAMTKARDAHSRNPASANVLPEYKLWEDHWIKCSQELGQWDLLMEFGKSKGNNNPFLVLESGWRVPDWPSMKEALAQVEKGFPDSILYKHDLYRAYIEICNSEDQQHPKVLQRDVEKFVENSCAQAIRLWKRLPSIISQQHVPLLQASQQIVELLEASQIRTGIQPQSIGRNTSLHDMKAIIKTWKNRLPMISDGLSHWSDIFHWRHHHYNAVVSAYEAQNDQTNHSMQGVHASAWSIIRYGQIARKQSLTGVCLDSLSRIHTIPSVPIIDCFQKIRQQVKCYLQMAGTMRKQELQEGLDVIESTNLKYFSKEMTAEFYALKGTFLAQIGRSEDANKAFSQAVQMHDNLIKGWALWGDYLAAIFLKERTMTLGVYVIICYMQACRNPNEAKCRKYLARTLWLLTYDDEKGVLGEALEKYCVGVPPVHWLPWIPQLLTCLTRKDGLKVSNLLLQIGRVHAQAVYFPIRTLYLALKLELLEKYKHENNTGANKTSKQSSTTSTTSTTTTTMTTASILPTSTMINPTDEQNTKVEATLSISTVTQNATSVNKTSISQSSSVDSTSSSDSALKPNECNTSTTSSNSAALQGQGGGEAMRVTPSMRLCSRIMHALRDLHPTLLAALEGIVDQMTWFRECWHEEVLRQLRQVLTKCYQVAFQTRTDVSNAKVTPHTMSYVKKLVSTFGMGFELGGATSQQSGSTGSESLARRAHATVQDPMFQKLKEQFTADFDFKSPCSLGLHYLIAKLKKWIKILEAKTKLLSSSFLLEERCRYLSVFSIATADVELPGEFLMPKSNIHSYYSIRIAQFMPRVELVQKHNMSARRLYIRANNGKIYPYLVVNDACVSDSRREERVLQLLRILNLYLEKRKESSRRHLLFTVPRVVAVSPQMRLIQDSPSSISFKDIMKKHYSTQDIDEDTAVALYYEKLAAVQAKGEQSTHQVLRDIFKEIQSTIAPEVILKEWAERTYRQAMDYWTFRKQFTAQLALLQFAEFTLHLSKLSPEMLQIIRDNGRLNVTYYKFEIDESKGELDANRPVPFRLTPNISGFISPVGIGGVLTSSMVAAARCLVDPKFSIDSILRAILRDEILSWHKKKYDSLMHSNVQSTSEQLDNEDLINLVNSAVGSVMTRLQNLAEFDGAETKVSTLVGAAMSADNLCRMDPAWHPWL
ncbi:transformation/transcription domain-associated protein-like isoform X2 [Xenia sp. Carnegie-2017]|uniref:transformation/transcription domain-associated protein-like isoform X2 n=1 Tax=Xenia sp. Carnegie-2017 TaxID=2897299 RepID=UPI001F048849|nr:transformation/transcription domain-associated protein-like isoform X2 [Xenia sp. Carnegie-2017]